MRRILYVLCGLVAGLALAPIEPAPAGERYGQRPPVVLSPDLSAPWVMQLQSPRGAVARNLERQRRAEPARRTSVGEAPAPASRARPAERVVAHAARTAQKPSFDPKYLPQIVDYGGPHPAGTVVVDTRTRFLYLVLDGGKARRYGVGVGKPGFEWSGTHRVSRKAEWPSWTPPKAMIAREAAKGRHLPRFMEGGPDNPLGARALYLGSTLYRIHGTNQPWTIGQNVSSGCIRMRNEDVMDLYERVGVGARVVVI